MNMHYPLQVRCKLNELPSQCDPRLCRSLDNTLMACVTLTVMIQVSKLFVVVCCLIIELEVNFGLKKKAVHIIGSLEVDKPFVYVYIVVFPPNYYFCLIKKCKLSSSLRFGSVAQSGFFFFFFFFTGSVRGGGAD